ncbi:MAG: hypothetical protein K6G83_05750 [Lachnospiraceae bacterium]|nr:hypothetical protein [Lachnospiraceae bacterium]
MKLIGKLKKQVEGESTREGRKSLIEKAGMMLTDEELDQVAGGDDAQPMYAYKCTACDVTYAAIIAGTECPKCKTTEHVIDLAALQ